MPDIELNGNGNEDDRNSSNGVGDSGSDCSSKSDMVGMLVHLSIAQI